MKNLTWQNPEQLFVAQELINKVKSKYCGIKDIIFSELEIIIAQLDFTFSGHEFIFTVIAPLFGVGAY